MGERFWEGSLTPAQMTAALAIVLLTFILLRRQVRRRPANRPASNASPLAHLPKQSQVESDLEVRLYDAFREMQGRLDTKIQVLSALVDQADRRIAVLRRLAGESDSPDPSADEESIDRAGEGPLVIEPERGGRTAGVDPKNAARAEALAASSSRFTKVYELADQGLSPSEIGERTGQAVREVELILGLRHARTGGSISKEIG